MLSRIEKLKSKFIGNNNSSGKSGGNENGDSGGGGGGESLRTTSNERASSFSTSSNNNNNKNLNNNRRSTASAAAASASTIPTEAITALKLSMGEGVSKSTLNENDLEVLHRVSKKPKEEIEFWFEHFLSECPSGKLDRDQFVKYYSSFRKNEKVDQIAQHAFNAFDAGRYFIFFILNS